ncbi:MAG: zeta toxin family protein [Streptosporangiaceae bacterium]
MAGPVDRMGLDRIDSPVPAPAGDLRGRLDRLPPGHPSSPHEMDALPRRPAPRPRDREPGADDLAPVGLADNADQQDRACQHASADRPGDQSGPDAGAADRMPLTDAEWDEHVAEVRNGLAGAAAEGLATRGRHTIDQAGKIWSAERDALHESIVEDALSQANSVPSERQAIIAGGLGGAGKSTVLSGHAGIDLSRYLTINPDDVKVVMARQGLIPVVENLSPMEASDLAHEESSYLAKRIAHRVIADGKNVIWDITMSTRASTEGRIDELQAAGYSVAGILRFRQRSWPRRATPPPTTHLELATAAQQDPPPDEPGSFDEVTAAYDRGELTRAAYRQLAEAAAEGSAD